MYTVRIAKNVVRKRHHNQIISMPDEDRNLSDVPLLQIIDNDILEGTTQPSQGQNQGSEVNSQNDETRRYPFRIKRSPNRYTAANYF